MAIRTLLISTAVIASTAPNALHAQIIAVKTAPVADGGQFAFLPSTNIGMGGASIAISDPALDPFVNPALGARSKGTRLFGAPSFFSMTRQAGGGFTFPLGVSTSLGSWFTQVALATQDVDGPANQNFVIPDIAPPLRDVVPGAPAAPPHASHANRYAHGLVGRRLPGNVSVAASASWWGIRAIDGVEMFYSGSNGVSQRGDALDLRLGMVKEWQGGRSFEALIVRNETDVTQDVAFSQSFWDPSRRQIVTVERIEPNADRTETYGIHLSVKQPLTDSWKAGGIFTANRIRQPSLPSYDLPVVPADDGRANAFNIGAGISGTLGIWTMGFDAILEPIWSTTHAYADEPTETRSGAPIEAGATTLSSDFRFINQIARLGFATTIPFSATRSLRLEAGGQLRAIQYRLEQSDAIRESQDRSTQRWNEWTRTWGAGVRLAGVDVRYQGHLTTGAGRPGMDDLPGGIVLDRDASLPGGVIAGRSSIPSFGITFANVRATTHQLSFSIPLR